jgi:hypothetical protein
VIVWYFPGRVLTATTASQWKTKGKNIRTASHEHSHGTKEDDSDDDYEGISVVEPQAVEDDDETHCNVRMRPPIDLRIATRIKLHLDMQADKSSVVVNGPFFPQVWTQGIESVEQMCDAKSYLLKPRTLRSSKGNLVHLI